MPRYWGLDLEFEKIESVRYVAGLWYFKVHPNLKPTIFSEQLLWSTSYYKTLSHSTTPRVELPTLAAVGLTLPSGQSSSASVQATKASPIQTAQGRRAYMFPSWSWATVKMPISFEYYDKEGPLRQRGATTTKRGHYDKEGPLRQRGATTTKRGHYDKEGPGRQHAGSRLLTVRRVSRCPKHHMVTSIQGD